MVSTAERGSGGSARHSDESGSVCGNGGMEGIFEKIQPVKYQGGKLLFLDQTQLPARVSWIETSSARDCADAIKRLALRGAPAIGIGAAFGLAVEARAASERLAGAGWGAFRGALRRADELLAASRPTAVNLFWALARMRRAAEAAENSGEAPERAAERLLEEAKSIQREDMAVCRRIGEAGQEIVKSGMGILTHCNAGALATSRYGTALAPIYVAKERGAHVRVYADETRPLLQGARLTAYELSQAGVAVTLIADGMAAAVMSQGWVQACIVGCDRVAANGDAANKIGTLGVAVLARHFGLPFYVACPLSTLDMSAKTGADIPIEQRGAEELTHWRGERIAPDGVGVYNPAFDVTPHGLISGIITERGILRPPYAESLERALGGAGRPD